MGSPFLRAVTALYRNRFFVSFSEDNMLPFVFFLCHIRAKTESGLFFFSSASRRTRKKQLGENMAKRSHPDMPSHQHYTKQVIAVLNK
jgi:hypothetical protein